MTENHVEKAEKAVEAIVYGTVGLALYVRDTAPSFLKLFVARGKNELGQQLGGERQRLHLLRSEDAHAFEGLARLALHGVGDLSQLHG